MPVCQAGYTRAEQSRDRLGASYTEIPSSGCEALKLRWLCGGWLCGYICEVQMTARCCAEKSMVNRGIAFRVCLLVCVGILFPGLRDPAAVAQDAANLPYMNQQLSPEQRAT